MLSNNLFVILSAWINFIISCVHALSCEFKLMCHNLSNVFCAHMEDAASKRTLEKEQKEVFVKRRSEKKGKNTLSERISSHFASVSFHFIAPP